MSRETINIPDVIFGICAWSVAEYNFVNRKKIEKSGLKKRRSERKLKRQLQQKKNKERNLKRREKIPKKEHNNRKKQPAMRYQYSCL